LCKEQSHTAAFDRAGLLSVSSLHKRIPRGCHPARYRWRPRLFGWARLAGHLMFVSAARALGLPRITAAWAAVVEKFLSWDIWVPAAIAVAAVLIILIFRSATAAYYRDFFGSGRLYCRIHNDRRPPRGILIAMSIRNCTCPMRVGLYGIKVRVFSQRQRM
jgi:hypothetical protein